MFEDVESKLIENETIEMALETDVRKTKKYWEKYVYSFILLIVLWALFVYAFCVTHTVGNVTYDPSGFGFDKYISFMAVSLITIFAVFSFLYDVMVNTKNRFNKYWITNLRVISFNNKKGYTIRNIERIDRIGTYNIKDNYADIILIFKKITETDKSEGPIALYGIKNYTDAVYAIREKNMDITVFTDENIGKKAKKIQTSELSEQTLDTNDSATTSTNTTKVIIDENINMSATGTNRHLGAKPNVDLNKIPMGEEEAQKQKEAMFKKIR